jgi:molybdenum cofactor cytidylyltransferase
MKIESIILAGGLSTRMGKPKQLIKIGNSTFLEIIFRNHVSSGVDNVIVVVPEFLKDDVKRLDLKNTTIIMRGPELVNPIDSLKFAVRYISENTDSFFVHPVDFPLVRAETIKLLIKTYRKTGNAIIKPIFNNKGGHPILLKCSLITEILVASSDIGLREIIRKDPARVYNLVVDDLGVIKNINTKEDLESTNQKSFKPD